MTVRTAPCNWVPDFTCCPGYDGASDELKALATGVATELLWRATGRRFGLCDIALRPCRKSCAGDSIAGGTWSGGRWGAPWVPYMQGGQWYNSACGSCVTDCSCGEICELLLPGPVHSVTSVKINGVLVPGTEYAVHDHRSLVRVGDGCWPDCQDLTADPDDVNGTAFEVVYQQGVPVPLGGQYAAGVYACELIKSCTGQSGCRLPRRVQSISREGVSMQFIDPLDFLKDGLTGLYEVDAWITSVNPDHLRQVSRVYSVDRLPPRTVTG